MSKPFGIDVSRHQGILNWDAIKAHELNVKFAGIRAGISWGYTDSWFARNWSEAKRVGIPRMAYHVLYPAENIQRQVDNFKKIVGVDTGELPVVADIELTHNLSKSAMANSILSYVQKLEVAFGRKPIIYSRASFFDYSVDENIFTKPYGNDYWWWLAAYPPKTQNGTEATFFPATPKGVDASKALIHQTSDTMPSIGETTSKSMDFNRWLKEPELLDEMTGVEIEKPPVIPEPNFDKEKIINQIDVIKDNFELLVQLVRGGE